MTRTAMEGVEPRVQIRIEVLRGRRVESIHAVDAAVVTADGQTVLRAGTPEEPVFVRSAIKPFQALPLVVDGAVERFGLTGEALALCCASHNGEDRHVAGVRSILEKIGLAGDDLACGPHAPFSSDAARGLAASGRGPGRLHNNCSGKHAGMLALARHHGWETVGYHELDHPVQQRVLDELVRWAGVDRDEVDTGVDGCGVPSFAIPLDALAVAFARLVAAARVPERPAARVVAAMAQHPYMVAGTNRLCTALMEATGGRIVAKVGAEGVYGAADRDRGLGIGVKARDGARRAGEMALLGVLEELDLLEPGERDALERWVRPSVKNTRGEVVGSVRAVVERPVRAVVERPTPETGAADVERAAEARLAPELRALVRLAASLTAGEAERIAAMDQAAALCPADAEEVILQSSLFLGYPVALNALGLWRRRTGRRAPEPEPEPMDPAEWMRRGEEVCRAVYAHQYEALREVMAGVHPDLDRWAVMEGYGKVLGRPGLDLRTRELCVGAMLSGIDATRQLHAHLRGCLNVGVDPATVSAMLVEVSAVVGDERAAAADRVWQRVRGQAERPAPSDQS